MTLESMERYKMKLNKWEQEQLKVQNNTYSSGEGYPQNFIRFEKYFYYIEKFGKMDLEAEVLDVGCGVGATEVYLKKYGFKKVEAIDFSKEGIKRAEKTVPDFNYLVGDIKELKTIYSGRMFDIIFCCQVLEHTPSDGLVLQSMYDLLKEDGIIIISVPYAQFGRNEHHCNLYDENKVEKMTKKICNSKPVICERMGIPGKMIGLLVIIRK